VTNTVGYNNVQREAERRMGGKEQMAVEVASALYFSRDWEG